MPQIFCLYLEPVSLILAILPLAVLLDWWWSVADTADIGEILKQTGNPTFTVGNSKSVANAIKKAFELNENGFGFINKERALINWNINIISEQYFFLINQTKK